MINHDRIKNKIEEDLKKYFDAEIFAKPEVDIKVTNKIISEMLLNITGNENNVKSEILWNTWNFKQKIKWYFLNRLNFGKLKKKEYEYIFSFLKNWDEDIAYDFKGNFYPEWMENNPKKVLQCNFTVKLPGNVELIQTDVNFGFYDRGVDND